MQLINKFFDDVLSEKLLIVYSKSDIIDYSAHLMSKIISGIKRRLHESEIPGYCDVGETTLVGLLVKMKKISLKITLKQLKGYCQYVTIREYGQHLEIGHFVAVHQADFREILKHKLEGQLTYREILLIQELDSWITVVVHAIQNTIDENVEKSKLKKDITLMNFESDFFK